VADRDGVRRAELQRAVAARAGRLKEFLRQLRRQIRIVDAAPLPVPVCRDQDDDLVLATAVAAGADAIVTGDEDLLVLRAHQTISILSPRQFIEAVTSRA